ncbi:hypothetical protein HNP99_001244 [Flavobacterium sp. 28A]|uniref:hypothetical protein n=1 Tax=Flavobacterium sp. 28A TaxID=2735895 RepID=UPI001570E8BC|nr:hypothetical protein [Flavobacterium sp. 28A]NRT14900.1 hypothetical protein [Flavobacterium sp. 28A]
MSDKIKFCTCVTTDVEKLKHYWKLYRFNKNNGLMCMGTPMIPTAMIDSNFKLNKTTLLNRVNEIDAFDIPLEFQNKDLLEIVINNNVTGIDRFTYSFTFTKDKWKAIGEDPFEIMNNYEEEQSGKIKSALKRNI